MQKNTFNSQLSSLNSNSHSQLSTINSSLLTEYNISQKPALEVLQRLGYTYISPEDCILQRGSVYNVLLKDVLRGQLRKINRYGFAGIENEFSSANIERAIDDLDEPLTEGLIKCSEKIFDTLLLGRSYPELVGNGKTLSFNLKYIDWDTIENNVFHVTEEYAVESIDKEHNTRPDIVLFINGIPFGVIECKSTQVPVEQAIEQMIRNQKADYTPQLFKYCQILMATNKNDVKYATTGTAKKFWAIWKEEETAFLEKELEKCIQNRTPTNQDKNIISLFHKERVFNLIKYFILFDANVKKICRYQQFYAIKEIVKTIRTLDSTKKRQSGVIWHTQGSGKSLTMVMLAKYILMELPKDNLEDSPKVIIITDRKELDTQITETFAHTKLYPARATSGRHLVELIKSQKADVVTTIINKFNTAERLDSKETSKNIFVLVDESHRSNYGQLATKMRTVFPNACYIGFTGTPLMKKEKNTMAKFGKLIHTYTIKDGVADGAIVPIIYEGKFVEQKVDEENIDLWFDETTKKLTDLQRKDLKNTWSQMKRLATATPRIRHMALDINKHFLAGYKNTGFKALLATNFKKDALCYLDCLESFGDLQCEVLISSPDMREGEEDIDEATDNKVLAFWKKKMNQYGDSDTYESRVKEQFQEGEIDILIVCSKLLTGFDAPICQVLYIDKELKEHGLLQAIARTNRLAEGKEYGHIVDYRGLIKKLNAAMDVYTGAGLENFEEGDLQGAVVDVLTAVTKLREAFTTLENLFITIKNKDDVEEFEVFLANDDIRHSFYNLLCNFGKALNIVLNSDSAYAVFSRKEINTYKDAFIFYSKMRKSVKIRYCDGIDNSEYEPLMQNLLNSHLSVVGIKQLTKPLDILDREEFEKELDELGSSRAKADAIVSSMTKSITQNYDTNPLYYESFSKRIKDTLQEYKDRVITEAEYLNQMTSIMNDYASGKTSIQYPEEIAKNIHAQAFYGVINPIFKELELVCNNEDLLVDITLKITDIIKKHCQIDWSQNTTIHSRIAQDIDDLFYSIEKTSGYKFSFDTIDTVIENVKIVAMRRF